MLFLRLAGRHAVKVSGLFNPLCDVYAQCRQYIQ